MCGICGFATRRDVTARDLKNMNDTMIHRGPDDSGEKVFVSGAYQIGLAQRRLSVIDLSPLGHQPMCSREEDITIVLNGEVYNYLELKKELDYPFISNSDTEVVLASYLKWGIGCVARFNGMLAFALYDHRENKLFLVRDRMGKKPFYYWIDGGNIVFASELKPIMAFPGFPKMICQEILPRYLYHQYINAPDSIFENVYKLEPGHFLVFQDGFLEKHCYWDLIKVYHEQQNDPVDNYEEAKTELKARLTEAVRLRMIADVPLGTFLSGGYDSSLITAIAQSISGEPVKTFTIGFEDEAYNEAIFARDISAHLGTDHTEAYITEAQMMNLVEDIPTYFDEPFADSSQIPTMLVSKLAKEKVTVVLSGDAGDELFCGYNVYDAMPIAQRLDLPGAVVYALSQLPLGAGRKLLDVLPCRVKIVAANRDRETKTQFGKIHYEQAVHSMAGEGLPVRYRFETSLGEPNWQRRRMLLDQLTYLPGDGLCKVDRSAMRFSLEARCPILDVNVVEYSFRLHHEFKYKGGVKKRILKDLAHQYIPKSLLDRPKKGFGVPIDKWLKTSLRTQLLDMSRKSALNRQGIFHPEQTQAIVDRFLGMEQITQGNYYAAVVWAFYVFQKWYERYISSF